MDESMSSEDTMSVDRNASCSMQEDLTDASHGTIDLVSSSESDDDEDEDTAFDGSSSKQEDDDDDYIDESEDEELQNYPEIIDVDDSLVSAPVENNINVSDSPVDMSQQNIRTAQFENSLSTGNNAKYIKYNSSSSGVPVAEGKPGSGSNSDGPCLCQCCSSQCGHPRKRPQESRKNKVTFKLPLKDSHQNKENNPWSANEMAGCQGIEEDHIIVVDDDDKHIDVEASAEGSKVYDPREYLSSRRILTATRRTASGRSRSSKRKLHASICCFTGYEQNHINYMRARESTLPKFQKQSPQLSERPRLVAFIKRVCSARHLSYTTTHLAVTLLDRFMDAHDVKISQLELISMTCLLIAAKYEECDENIPRISRLNDYCDVPQRYSVSFFYTMEAFLLNFFKWHLGFITPSMFAEAFFLRGIQHGDFIELGDSLCDTFDDQDSIVRSRSVSPLVPYTVGQGKNLELDQMPHRVKRETPSPTFEGTPVMVDIHCQSTSSTSSSSSNEENSATFSSQQYRAVKDAYDTSTSSGGSSSSYETISSYATVSPTGPNREGSSLGSSTNDHDDKQGSSVAKKSMCSISAIEKALHSHFMVSETQAPVASSSKLYDHPNPANDDILSSTSHYDRACSQNTERDTVMAQSSGALAYPPAEEAGDKGSSHRDTSSDRTTSTPSRSLRDIPSIPVSPVVSAAVIERVDSPNINLRTLTQEMFAEVKELLNKSMDYLDLVDSVPSEIAAACMLSARRELGIRPVWPSTLVNLTRYTEQQLHNTCSIISGSGGRALALFPSTPDSGYRSNAATPATSPGEPSPATPSVACSQSTAAAAAAKEDV